jgi:tetratricopeptide (TPR) repeat protein
LFELVGLDHMQAERNPQEHRGSAMSVFHSSAVRRIFALMVALFVLPLRPAASDLQKTQKKELESAAKALNAEAKSLEKSGKLVEARLKYAESLGYIEERESSQAISRLDDRLKTEVKAATASAQKMFDAGKYKEAAQTLEQAWNLQTAQPLLAYDLALCYNQLGERQKAAEYLDQAIAGAGGPKIRARLNQTRTSFTTAETTAAHSDSAKKQLELFDHLAATLGNGSSAEDELGDEEVLVEGDAPDPTASVRGGTARFTATGPAHGGKSSRFSSACTALQSLKETLANSPAAVFDLANCAEDNNRPDEAMRYLRRYLELAPNALDAVRVNQRIAELDALKALPTQSGAQVRALYATAERSIEEHQYDGALMAYTKAGELLPDFPLTHWKLGLLQEAMGNVAEARKQLARCRESEMDPEAQKRADFHLGILDEKRKKYDEEVSEAEDIIADLLNRSMNLTFNGLENRSALRAHRAQVKKGNAAKKLGGFTVPLPYAQQQIGSAAQHLQAALALFPLGAEANELMALVYLQSLDGRSAIRSFDAVSSQQLPVSFYAEIRGHGVDRPAKCELSRDHIRFIFLASYDKKGVAKPPSRRAGQDGLGDLVIEAQASRALNFEDFAFRLSEIKKVETKDGQILFKLEHDTYSVSPLAIAFLPPKEGGPFARRFSNDYARLFMRYPGLEDTKLGAEGLTGYEKFKIGMDVANAGMSMAMGGPAAFAAVQDIITVVQTVRMLQTTMASLKISYTAWATSVEEEQDVLLGNPFKPIPTEPVRLAYLHELK